MIEIPGLGQKPDLIEFGDGKTVAFTLPVLGSPGVPVGVMSAVSVIATVMDLPEGERNEEATRAWAYFVQTLADNFPTASRHLGRMDQAQLQHVITGWFEKSAEQGGFDPKAGSSSRS